MKYVKLKLSFKEKFVFLFTGLLKEEHIKDEPVSMNPLKPKQPSSRPIDEGEEVKLEMPSLFNRKNKKKVKQTNLR